MCALNIGCSFDNAEMEERVQQWKYDIGSMDTYKDRSDDATDDRVLYAATSRCSGLRYLVKSDEFFAVTSPMPGNRTFEIFIIFYFISGCKDPVLRLFVFVCFYLSSLD